MTPDVPDDVRDAARLPAAAFVVRFEAGFRARRAGTSAVSVPASVAPSLGATRAFSSAIATARSTTFNSGEAPPRPARLLTQMSGALRRMSVKSPPLLML